MMKYADLLARTDAPPGSSWGLFGADDELGSLNFLTPARVRDAAGLVKRGTVFNLDCALDAFQPPIARHRNPPKHTIFSNSPFHNDDYLDSFYLQATSQIDGLRHFRHPRYGFYNDALRVTATPEDPHLGIARMAEHGIVGRGVLLDVERYLVGLGRRLDHRNGGHFDVAVLDAVAASQGISFQPGDLLLVRTGWLNYYFNEASDADRAALPSNLISPGLVQSHDSLAWLWDHQFSVLAFDNAGVECVPAIAASPFIDEMQGIEGVNAHHAPMMHPYLIALLGFVLGELWNLEALADDCAADGVYEFLVSSKPLNLRGGVGSPANAMAIK
ncbi:hypothetical protein FHS85_002619 [Rhodoligotrophos appendicifer]|uniref:cyclase family protein n=1 Tax=Rhodoligotrophos appendicifer TaxID=987056 RepID=UPI0011857006|nr:cyclase family protein [Rhodoligotrophos appendicifer]